MGASPTTSAAIPSSSIPPRRALARLARSTVFPDATRPSHKTARTMVAVCHKLEHIEVASGLWPMMRPEA
eukprot:5690470-Prymnesium_polylepis.2